MPKFRRAYNADDVIEFVQGTKVFCGKILQWLMNEQRYRVEKESGEIVWVNPNAVLKKVVSFELKLE